MLSSFYSHYSHSPSLSSSIISTALSGVIFGCTLSFTVITGARPQAPRHDTISIVNIISSVVCFPFPKPKCFSNASLTGTDLRTWHAVPSPSQVKDLSYDKVKSLKPSDSVLNAYNTMIEKGTKTLPVVSVDGKFEGIITMVEIAKSLMYQHFRKVNIPLEVNFHIII